MTVWIVNHIVRAANKLYLTDISRAYSKKINESQCTVVMWLVYFRLLDDSICIAKKSHVWHGPENVKSIKPDPIRTQPTDNLNNSIGWLAGVNNYGWFSLKVNFASIFQDHRTNANVVNEEFTIIAYSEALHKRKNDEPKKRKTKEEQLLGETRETGRSCMRSKCKRFNYHIHRIWTLTVKFYGIKSSIKNIPISFRP